MAAPLDQENIVRSFASLSRLAAVQQIPVALTGGNFHDWDLTKWRRRLAEWTAMGHEQIERARKEMDAFEGDVKGPVRQNSINAAKANLILGLSDITSPAGILVENIVMAQTMTSFLQIVKAKQPLLLDADVDLHEFGGDVFDAVTESKAVGLWGNRNTDDVAPTFESGIFVDAMSVATQLTVPPDFWVAMATGPWGYVLKEVPEDEAVEWLAGGITADAEYITRAEAMKMCGATLENFDTNNAPTMPVESPWVEVAKHHSSVLEYLTPDVLYDHQAITLQSHYERLVTTALWVSMAVDGSPEHLMTSPSNFKCEQSAKTSEPTCK